MRIGGVAVRDDRGLIAQVGRLRRVVGYRRSANVVAAKRGDSRRFH